MWKGEKILEWKRLRESRPPLFCCCLHGLYVTEREGRIEWEDARWNSGTKHSLYCTIRESLPREREYRKSVSLLRIVCGRRKD